jgi:hypothetical protein
VRATRYGDPIESAAAPASAAAPGTLVFEQLAAIGRVEDFFVAIDSDDVHHAGLLMKEAEVDPSTIAMVIGKTKESADKHGRPRS